MRISTMMEYKSQLASINKQTSDLNNINERINTSKKLINSSDNPILAQRIKSTEDYINQINAFEQNTTNAQNRFNLLESSVKQSLDVVGRVRELIRSAQSDTASPTDRQNMVKELSGLLKNLRGFANTKDPSGDYIFSGTSTNTPSFTYVNGVYEYTGSQTTTSINVSETINQTYNESGQTVFGDIRQGNGIYTITQSGTPNTGTAETSTGEVTSQTDYVQDTYTLSFVTNGNGDLAYQVTGASSGQVIPVPPATTPTDAIAYQSGDAITFNGISFTVTGAPDVGDSFVIAPSTSQNALETINQVVSVIGSSINNNVEKAAYHQQLSQLSASVDQIDSHLTNYLSEIGYRSATVDTQITANKNIIIDQTKILSNLSDADLTKLVPEMKQKMLGLEITSQSYTKLSELFSELMRMSLS